MNQYGVIANPNAGPSKGSWRHLRKVFEFAKDKGIPIIVTDDVTQVSQALIKLISEKNVSVLCVYGGDGTVHVVVDILIFEHKRGRIPYLPKIVSLGGGTMDAIHKGSLGWTIKPALVLAYAYQYPDKPTTTIRPLAIQFFNLEKNRQETRYGFMFIMGIVARIVDLYDKEGRSIAHGARTIAKAMLASLTGYPLSHSLLMADYQVQLTVDGTEVPQSKSLSLFCNATKNLIFGAKPFAGQKANGHFYALSYNVTPAVATLMVPIIARKWWVPQGDRFLNQPVSRIDVTTPESLMQLDGEFLYARPDQQITITTGPEIEFLPAF